MIEAIVKEKNMLSKEILQLLLQPMQSFEYKVGDYLTLGFENNFKRNNKDDSQDIEYIEHFKPFSIANIPNKNNLLELHIKLYQQKVNYPPWFKKISNVNIEDYLWINGPFSQYHLDTNIPIEKNIILIAGGTGFSLIKALLEQLVFKRQKNKIYLYWGVESSQDIYLKNWIEYTLKKNTNITFIPVVSEHTARNGKKTLVHKAVLEDFPDLSSSKVYLCGSWEMQEVAKKDFIAAGLAPDSYN